MALSDAERLALCSGHYELPGLQVQVEETVEIIPEQDRECPAGFLFKLANGELVGGGVPSLQPDMTWRRSRDGGRTWREAPAWPSFNAFQFPDGEIIEFGRLGDPWLVRTETPGVYEDVVYRSTDGGQTHQAETVPISGVPTLAIGSHEYWGEHVRAYTDHSIVQLQDGSLLASLLGWFEGDRKGRVFAVRSTDKGRTWNYHATVAFDLNPSEDLRITGFSEPDMLILPNGELLCFMRTGGTYDGRFTSLYQSRSIDAGLTWSVPDPIADRGVWPNACRMSNGVIAVIYGRPGDWLTFSLDNGYTWMGHFCLHLGPQPWDCGSYDWVEEVAPDTLLAAYARTDPNDPRQSKVVGTFIKVRRT